VKNITTVGLDLAKNVFQAHGVDERGKAVLRKTLKRTEMASFFGKLPACLVGMEACSGAHFWARKLTVLGHTVRLMGSIVCQAVWQDGMDASRFIGKHCPVC
jgi:transposase